MEYSECDDDLINKDADNKVTKDDEVKEFSKKLEYFEKVQRMAIAKLSEIFDHILILASTNSDTTGEMMVTTFGNRYAHIGMCKEFLAGNKEEIKFLSKLSQESLYADDDSDADKICTDDN